MEMFQNQIEVLEAHLNLLNTIELYSLKQLVLCYVNFYLNLKNKWGQHVPIIF